MNADRIDTGRRTACGIALAWLAGAVQAQPHHPEGRALHGGPPRGGAEPQRWFDGAHGHNRYYPAPGWAVGTLPPHARTVFWGGVGYRYFEGVWYAPGPRGYLVARPPFGVVVADLPPFYTVLTIAGLAYLYANGVYYREHAGGGYEVVAPPPAAASAPADKLYVYPRQGQTAEQQAGDEYECHRWAVQQAGFDPTAAAVGQGGAGDAARRGDYQRARSACLEGRGYTVR